MPEDEKLSETIRELYAIVNQLERDYNKHDRRFTLDGHLLGSIGEVYAAERYGIELAKSSSERRAPPPLRMSASGTFKLM